MNSPAPGWLPDPTGRHEHRYWDGFNWTSDVSDGGVTSFDPYEAAPQQPQQPLGYGPQGYSSGPYGAQPAGGGGSGPSTGLLVGLGAAILVVIIAIVFVVASGGDDDDNDPIATTDENSDDSGDDTTDTTGDDSSDTTDGGDSDISESDQVIIDGMAAGIMSSSNGALTQEDADCIAEEMYTEIGFERLAEMTADADPTDPLGGFSSEELAEVMDVMLTCVDAETLVDMGYDQGG